MTVPREQLMEKVVALTKRRGFIYPSSEIYGGSETPSPASRERVGERVAEEEFPSPAKRERVRERGAEE